MFTDYIQNGAKICRQIVKHCIDNLIDRPLIETNLPTSAEITLRQQKDRWIVHILHYIAERKCRKIDIVDTKIPLQNIMIKIRTGFVPKSVYIAPEIKELDFDMEDDYMVVSINEIFGHEMLVIE